MRFAFARARDDAELTAAYVALKERVFPAAAWALFDFKTSDLLERDALIAAMVAGKPGMSLRVIAALHIVMDGLRTAHLQGVVTEPTIQRRGLGTAILARTLDFLAWDLAIEAAELTTRIRADGSVNESALFCFRKAGFAPVEDIRVRITGSPCDAHLRQTSEGGGTFFRARRMRADLAQWQRSPAREVAG